jgi:hypothetical protein
MHNLLDHNDVLFLPSAPRHVQIAVKVSISLKLETEGSCKTTTQYIGVVKVGRWDCSVRWICL